MLTEDLNDMKKETYERAEFEIVRLTMGEILIGSKEDDEIDPQDP